jgi:hypothetical protein
MFSMEMMAVCKLAFAPHASHWKNIRCKGQSQGLHHKSKTLAAGEHDNVIPLRHHGALAQARAHAGLAACCARP